MATFPDIAPNYGATKQSQPRVRNVQFGDGFSQRLRYGLNQDAKVWDLTWEHISEADSDTIEAFLEARGGAEDFEWSPPDETETYKWICQRWSKRLTASGLNSLSATFQQVFEV
jgi:phage-related protein